MIMSCSVFAGDVCVGLCHGLWHGCMQAFGSKPQEQLQHRSRECRYEDYPMSKCNYYPVTKCNSSFCQHIRREALRQLLSQQGGARWLCHFEMLWAAADGCVHCVKSYVDKKGSKIDDRTLGIWDGTEDDPTYNAWKATFHMQNQHSFPAQEQVRVFLLTQPGAEKEIQSWETHKEDRHGVHKKLLARREHLKRKAAEMSAADEYSQDHGSASDAGREEDGSSQSTGSDSASSWQRVGGTPGGEAGLEKSRCGSWETWSWKNGGMPAGTAPPSDSSFGSGAHGCWYATEWGCPWWRGQEGDDERFRQFLQACKDGDAEAVKAAVKENPSIVMQTMLDPSGLEMRASDWATMGRYAGRACLEVLTILQGIEEAQLKAIWARKG